MTSALPVAECLVIADPESAVTVAGGVKLLDFGLAKAVDDQSWLLPDATHSPTLSLGQRRPGRRGDAACGSRN